MNSKLLIIGIFAFFFATTSFGQTSSEVVSTAICKCLDGKIPTTKAEHLKDTVSRCIGRGMTIDMAGLRKEYNMKDETTVEQVQEIVRRLVEKLTKTCETFKGLTEK